MQTRNVLGKWWIVGVLVLVTAAPATGDEFEHRQGRHIHLITDLPSSQDLDEMVAAFDAAVPLWEKFWNLPSGALNDWQVEAHVMRNAEAFEAAGMIDSRVPAFSSGYALGNRLWIRVQPSVYYTRHLVLHEGAHALAFDQFSGAGPTWFMEGTAEMLATHHQTHSQWLINQVPHSREAYPFWGRFKRMTQLREAGTIPRIETVMKYQPSLRGDVESYAWSWAAAKILHGYPEYRPVLLEAARQGTLNDLAFNRRLYQELSDDWPILSARWRVLTQDFDYGYDFERERLQIAKKDPLFRDGTLSVIVASDQGWQSIGVRVAGGTKLRINGTGRITIDDQPKPWVCEPPGVTIEYHRGRPLGQLIACVLPNATRGEGYLPPLKTFSIGSESTVEIRQPSWLLLRVNDRPDSLANNVGNYTVTVAKQN